MRQPTAVKDAKTMVKERWLDRRVDKLTRENEELRGAVEDLRHDLDVEHDRSKDAMQALSKSKRRPGRMKWLMLAGGAYVLGTKAGRGRYEQMKSWVRSVMPSDDSTGNGSAGTPPMPSTEV